MTFPTVDLVSVRRRVSTDTIMIGENNARLARMTIVGESADAVPVYVPYAPVRVEHGNLGGSYNFINRPGQADATVFGSPRVPNMQFDLLLLDKTQARQGIGTPVTVTAALSIINTLKGYSEKGQRVRITYGALESGLWYIDEISVSTMKRDPVTDEVIQAAVSLSCTRASDIQDGLGPVTGGAETPAPPTNPAPPQQTSARYYTVKSGDTLWAISIKYYGTGTRWTEIADANGIKDPRTLQIGKVLRIP